MGFYASHVVPFCTDYSCGASPITKQREKIVPRATGVVLEVGIGTGRNLPHYDPGSVSRVIGVDPDKNMWRRSAERRAACPFDVQRIGLSGERIPLDAGTADTVVVTYSLCTIPDPVAAVKEMRRVLKPGGDILFTEHGMAPDAHIRRWQERIDPVWRRSGGCNSGRDIPALFRAAGLEFDELEEMYVPGPRVLSYNYWGAAH